MKIVSWGGLLWFALSEAPMSFLALGWGLLLLWSFLVSWGSSWNRRTDVSSGDDPRQMSPLWPSVRCLLSSVLFHVFCFRQHPWVFFSNHVTGLSASKCNCCSPVQTKNSLPLEWTKGEPSDWSASGGQWYSMSLFWNKTGNEAFDLCLLVFGCGDKERGFVALKSAVLSGRWHFEIKFSERIHTERKERWLSLRMKNKTDAQNTWESSWVATVNDGLLRVT